MIGPLHYFPLAVVQLRVCFVLMPHVELPHQLSAKHEIPYFRPKLRFVRLLAYQLLHLTQLVVHLLFLVVVCLA